MPRARRSIQMTHTWEGTTHHAVQKRGYVEDSVEEMLAWLFVKTDEEIVEEAEVAALHSMLLVEDPRPDRAGYGYNG
jgi:hypothetical protein